MWARGSAWPNTFPPTPQGNSTRGAVTLLRSRGNIVYSTQPARIALLGVEDLIVVQTADALLIAAKDSADEIRRVVEQVPESLR